MANFTVKIASLDALVLMIKWAEEEGWNPGLYDYLPFQITDPNGFYCGYLGDQLIACISIVRYPPSFAFLGFYIVHPEYRGMGYGLQLWQSAMHHAQGYNIGLDGVISQQKNYSKSGFELAYKHLRFAGRMNKRTNSISNKIVHAHTLPINMLLDYDRLFFPAKRDSFLTAWMQLPKSTSLVYVENQAIKGFGVIRECIKGYKIGPLYAEDPEIAETLLMALANEANDEVMLDIPEINVDALQLVRTFNFKEIFQAARMYTGSIPQTDLTRIYANTTLELG